MGRGGAAVWVGCSRELEEASGRPWRESRVFRGVFLESIDLTLPLRSPPLSPTPALTHAARPRRPLLTPPAQ